MADIATLPTLSARVNEDAVSKLEHLLDMARAGEIESVIAAGFKPTGNWMVVMSGQIDTLKKVGALEAMKADLLKTLETT